MALRAARPLLACIPETLMPRRHAKRRDVRPLKLRPVTIATPDGGTTYLGLDRPPSAAKFSMAFGHDEPLAESLPRDPRSSRFVKIYIEPDDSGIRLS